MISIRGISPGYARKGSLYVPSEEKRVRAAQYLPPRERERRQQECAFSGPLGMGSHALLGSTGEWTPINLPGLSLWLRADAGILLGSVMWATGTSPPAITLTGDRNKAIGLRVEITAAGPRGAALFRYSADNGATWIGVAPSATAASVALTGEAAGLTLNFASGDYSTDNVYRATVTTWSDLGGVGINFTQGISGNQPPITRFDANLNGRTAISFDRTPNRLVGPSSLTSLGWLGVVATYPATTFSANSTILLHGNSDVVADTVLSGATGTANWRTDTMPGTRYRDGAATNVALTTANAPHVYEFVPDGGPFAGSSNWHLGNVISSSVKMWLGAIAEVVICSSDPSADDKLKWRTYCQQRYGTP